MFNISMMIFHFSIVLLMLQNFYDMSFKIRINNLKTVSHLKINRVLTEVGLDSESTRVRYARDLRRMSSNLLGSLWNRIYRRFGFSDLLNSLPNGVMDYIHKNYYQREYDRYNSANNSSTEYTSPASISHVSTLTSPTTTTSPGTTSTSEQSTVVTEKSTSTTPTSYSNISPIFPSTAPNKTLDPLGNSSNPLIAQEISSGISGVACTGLLCTPGIVAFPVTAALLGSTIFVFLLYKYTPIGSWLGRNNSKKKKGKKRMHEEDVENILNAFEYSDETGESISKKSKFDRFLRSYGWRLKYPYIDEDVTEEAMEDVTIL